MLQIVKRERTQWKIATMNRHFTEEEIKKCSASLAVKDLQIRTTKKVLFYTHPNSKDQDA